jgi:hypothetical protein
MSVQRLEAKCVELVARGYDRYVRALEGANVAPPVWDALWECMLRRNLFAVGAAERWDFGPLLRHRLQRPSTSSSCSSSSSSSAPALDVSGDVSGARAAPLSLHPWLAQQIVAACPSLYHIVPPSPHLILFIFLFNLSKLGKKN